MYQDSFDRLQLRDPDSNHKVLAYRNQKPREKSHSLVGTPNYIAPEVLTRSGTLNFCYFSFNFTERFYFFRSYSTL